MNAATHVLPGPGALRLRLFVLALFSALVLALASGCGTDDKNLYDTAANGQTITIDRGDMFRVRLMLTTGTGAKWDITELDRNIVEQMGEPKALGQVIVGALPRIYSYHYMFKGHKSGKTKLRFELRAPDKADPLETLEMTIVVK
jgi:hypothetical protein